MLSFLYVYNDHSILECYNLFSGVELSMRLFFVITRTKGVKLEDMFLVKIASKGTSLNSTEEWYERNRTV